MDVLLVAGGSPEDWPVLKDKYDQYIGIDRGALYLTQHGLPLDLAIGDFDSLNAKEKERVKRAAQEMRQAPAEKDDTDTQLGLVDAWRRYPEATITLIGATGGRIDHLLANLWLPLEPRFRSHAQQLIVSDRQNHITFYLPGEHRIEQLPEMKYLAYCCLTPVAQLAIRKSKYELEPTDVLQATSYASNEFVSETAEFSFLEGVVAVIQSKD